MRFFKKIYFPGIITLLGIVIWFSVRCAYLKKYVSIEILEPTHSDFGCYRGNDVKLKKLKTSYYNIKGDVNQAALITQQGIDRLETIMGFKDSTQNVAFVVKGASYGDMINIYNQCLIHGVNEYTFYRDTLFVIHERTFLVNEPNASVWLITGACNEDGILCAPPSSLN